jgi:tRNA-specific 2-thiouridylase
VPRAVAVLCRVEESFAMASSTLSSSSTKERVVAAMSGGVDSAVAAGLLVEAGYDVVGVTMKMYEATKAAHAKSCCGADDFDDARRSAAVLGIPHFVLDYTEPFSRGVMERFRRSYASGETPNPCISCNNFVKLGTLRRYAASIGATKIATGHYARLEHDAAGPHLYRVDHPKDQAYALAGLRREQLAALLLPLGPLTKDETREHARRLGLGVHDKTESQDICFVEGGDYRDLLKDLDAAPGPFVERDGSVGGTHNGIVNYTVGQRARIGGATRARYVTRIDAATNTIVLGDLEDLESVGLRARELNVIQTDRFSAGPTPVLAMIRSHAIPAAAVVEIDEAGDSLSLRFEIPQAAVSPGQQVALLDPATSEVLAAATIVEGLN